MPGRPLGAEEREETVVGLGEGLAFWNWLACRWPISTVWFGLNEEGTPYPDGKWVIHDFKSYPVIRWVMFVRALDSGGSDVPDHLQRGFPVEGFGRVSGRDGVVPEAFDRPGDVRAEAGHVVGVDGVAFCDELAEGVADVDHVVQGGGVDCTANDGGCHVLAR